MALQTTLAAWVRTATSLIGFGFAIVQFLEHFGRLGSGAQPKSALRPHCRPCLNQCRHPYDRDRNGEYRIAVKYLESDGFRGVAGIPTLRREPPDVAVWMAVLVCLIGVLAFALILTTTEWR